MPTIASSAESGSPSSSRPDQLSAKRHLLSHENENDDGNNKANQPPLGTTPTPAVAKDRGGRTRGRIGKDHHPRSVLFSVSAQPSKTQVDQNEFELQEYPQPKQPRTDTADDTADTNRNLNPSRDRAARKEEKKARKRRWLEAQDDMKFSHSIQFNAVPDWSTHYIAYSNLKKL